MRTFLRRAIDELICFRYTDGMMSDLRQTWQLRNDLAAALEITLVQLQRELRTATLDEVVAFVDTFAPGQAASPEWTASFDRFAESAWDALNAATLAQLEQVYRQRGPFWVAIANSFSAPHGERLRQRRWKPGGARLPAVVLR